MSEYAKNINNLIKQNKKSGGDGDFFNFAPMTNTYYRILSSMLPDKKLNKCIDIGCYFGDFGNSLLQDKRIQLLHNVDCSEEAIKIGQQKHKDKKITWEVNDAINLRLGENVDIVLLMGIIEKYSLEMATEIIKNLHRSSYILISFTMPIMKKYAPEQLVTNVSSIFKLFKEVDYRIHYREQYEKHLKPQANHHKFLLFGKK